MSATQPAARRPHEVPDEAPPPQLPPSEPVADFDRAANVDWAPVVIARDATKIPAPSGRPGAPTPVAPALPPTVSEAEKKNVRRVLRASTFKWMSILGVTGFVLGSVCGGWYASRMGYDAGLSSLIGVLIGTAVGGAGMTIPPLFRAIGWGVLAAATGGVGAGALWILTKVAPALVERILH